jgi:cytochrome c-type biogenesis protein CcmH/NrfF
MQAVGMTDAQIIQAFVRDSGAGIYLAPPNAFGWIIPYATAGFGLAMILLFLRKVYKQRPMTELGAVPADDPTLARYKDQIERESAHLDLKD